APTRCLPDHSRAFTNRASVGGAQNRPQDQYRQQDQLLQQTIGQTYGGFQKTGERGSSARSGPSRKSKVGQFQLVPGPIQDRLYPYRGGWGGSLGPGTGKCTGKTTVRFPCQRQCGGC